MSAKASFAGAAGLVPVGVFHTSCVLKMSVAGGAATGVLKASELEGACDVDVANEPKILSLAAGLLGCGAENKARISFLARIADDEDGTEVVVGAAGAALSQSRSNKPPPLDLAVGAAELDATGD